MQAIHVDFDKLIGDIKKTKFEFNDLKIEGWGHNDVDDHGWVPLERPDFDPEVDPESGLCSGPALIGRSYRAWLAVHPVYIHPSSAVAGAWVSGAPRVGEWKDHPQGFEELWERYNIRQPGVYGMNHSAPDMTIGLTLGFGGILDKIRHYRGLNAPQNTDFYDGEENMVLGMREFVKRHAEEAALRALAADDDFEKQNYAEIARMNEWLVDNPPRTLREAIQFLAWFQTFDRMYFVGGAMQQIDTLLLPYYQKDRVDGVITNDDEVVWYLVSLLFNDTHYHQIGGPSPADGHDMTNPISFAMLEAMHKSGIPSNVALRLHEHIDDDLMNKAIRYLFEDGTGVSFSCANGLDSGFVRNGYPLQVARMRGKVGCNWTALPGIEYCLQDVTRACMVAPFLVAFYEMIDDETCENSIEILWEKYAEHLEIEVETIKRGFDWHYENKQYNVPEMVLNLFCHGSIERGLDISAGGTDIYNFTLDAAGLATAADSFGAIQQRVVEEKSLDWETLADLLRTNFAGRENERLMLKNIPRFGSGDSPSDRWADKISALFTDVVKKSSTPKHKFNVIPGIFSHGIIFMLGENLGATPNGRFAGTEISHSADPDPGFMANGTGAPTAKSNAVARVQPGWGNSAPLQVDLDSSLVNELGGVEMIKAYLKAHNQMGGTLININVVSKEKLLAAHDNPDLYPDLVVRVTGYSAFFKSLSREYRQQVVDRFLAAN